jgi:hypothetical protein
MADTKHNLDFKLEHYEEDTVQDPDAQPPPTPEELMSVRRRIDLQLMPILVGTYALQFYGEHYAAIHVNHGH